MITWAHVRALGGRVLLRIDDLDTPRTKAGAESEALHDLRWLGLDWDESADAPVLRQTERAAIYQAAADALLARGSAYPCVCTRSEIAAAASAPHGPEGPAYPRTCLGRYASLEAAEAASGRPAALRFRVPDEPVTFHDRLFGAQSVDLSLDGGDFPILRRTGEAAYQLATVVDDAASGVDLVIRGADLLASTARQRLLQTALGLPFPATLHLPLVVGEDGRRLAKRHGDTRLGTLRRAGWTPERLVGWIASTLGIAAPGGVSTARELARAWDPGCLGTDPVTVRAVDFLGEADGP